MAPGYEEYEQTQIEIIKNTPTNSSASSSTSNRNNRSGNSSGCAITTFYEENKAAITTGVIAVGLIAIGILTFGAGFAVAGIIGLGLIGAGTSVAVTEIVDFAEDGKYNKSSAEYIEAGVSGFVFGSLTAQMGE